MTSGNPKISPRLAQALEAAPPRTPVRLQIMLNADASAADVGELVRRLERGFVVPGTPVEVLQRSKMVVASVEAGAVGALAALLPVLWLDESRAAAIESVLDRKD